jgi:hypothetical protein
MADNSPEMAVPLFLYAKKWREEKSHQNFDAILRAQ